MTSVANDVAFLFPGQGSQSVGMLSELAAVHSEVAETFAEASAVLGYDLWNVVQVGPEERLNLTEFTQPAMLAADVAIWRVWCRVSACRPGWMAGHSLGEYSALVCAGALTFETAARLVQERARAMQSAVPPGAGAMAAILGLDESAIGEVCAEYSSTEHPVAPANLNAPGQVVVAGANETVARVVEAAKVRGAKRAVLLPVSVPSHCVLMQSAADRLAAMLQAVAVQSPRTAVVHNVDAAVHADPIEIRAALQKQLYCCVRWTESVRFMHSQGVGRFVECGPGKVLTGLNKRIVPDGTVLPIFDPLSLEKALEVVR